MDINTKIAEELGIRKEQASAAVKLIDEGCTIPFIARYRKEATGALSDEILRNLYDRLVYLRNLEDKKQTVLASIEEQGKLTEELRTQVFLADNLVLGQFFRSSLEEDFSFKQQISTVSDARSHLLRTS